MGFHPENVSIARVISVIVRERTTSPRHFDRAVIIFLYGLFGDLYKFPGAIGWNQKQPLGSRQLYGPDRSQYLRL